MADFDVAIIGGGPAGMSAAIYLARAGRKAVLLEAGMPGGQVFLTHLVENYPGFAEPLTGSELSQNMKAQVERLGVEIKLFPVSGIEKKEGIFNIKGLSSQLTARAVIFSTGAKPKPLGVDGEAKFFGAGVSYCSTCDGMFFRGKNVFVIGGGNSAVEGAEYLSRLCKTVSLVHRRDKFRADDILVERVRKIENVNLHLSAVLEKINGDKNVNSVNIRDLKTGSVTTFPTDGVFIYVGILPQSDLVSEFVDLDEIGHIKTDKNMATKEKGLYAAGDVIVKDIRQIITAASDGCVAALSVVQYLLE